RLTSLGGPAAIGDNAVHQVETGCADAKGASSAAKADTAGSRDNDRRHSAMTNPRSAIELSRTAAIQLWIDGVGCWTVFPSEQLTIGGPVEPGSSQAAADLCVLANLRRIHATIERSGESYRLES